MSGILWPVKGTVTQRFGRPALQAEPTAYLQIDFKDDRRARWTAFTGGVQYADVHMGTDVSCAIGTPVLAPNAGKVLRCNSYRVWNPFKNAYVIANDIWFGFDGALMYVAHLSKFVLAEGTHANRGQLIARTGASGVATGPHAHIEIIQGTDPHYSTAQFRWNPQRVQTGGDLAGLPWL